MRLKARVDALEVALDCPKTLVSVIQRTWQTEDEAIAAHEAEHGPIDLDERDIMLVVIQKHDPLPADA